MTKYKLELTDLYGGEANYGWCRRATVELPEGIGDKWLLLAAREWAGFSGMRCAVERHHDSADTYEIRPRGLLQVLFVSIDETPAQETSIGDVRAWAQTMLAASTTEYASLVRPEEKLVAQAIADACAAHRNEGATL